MTVVFLAGEAASSGVKGPKGKGLTGGKAELARCLFSANDGRLGTALTPVCMLWEMGRVEDLISVPGPSTAGSSPGGTGCTRLGRRWGCESDNAGHGRRDVVQVGLHA